MKLAAAVEARIELDLRIGASLTRRQTMGLQTAVVDIEDRVVSYGPSEIPAALCLRSPVGTPGPCQFPTLGFVVDQYERVQAFEPEPFWYISVGLDPDPDSDDAGEGSADFTWKRGRLFDQELAIAIYEPCTEDPEATVVRAETKPTSKWYVLA